MEKNIEDEPQVILSNLSCEAICNVHGIKELLLLLQENIFEYPETKHLADALHVIINCTEKTGKILEEMDDNIYPKQ